jgi:hypothetical protein
MATAERADARGPAGTTSARTSPWMRRCAWNSRRSRLRWTRAVERCGVAPRRVRGRCRRRSARQQAARAARRTIRIKLKHRTALQLKDWCRCGVRSLTAACRLAPACAAPQVRIRAFIRQVCQENCRLHQHGAPCRRALRPARPDTVTHLCAHVRQLEADHGQNALPSRTRHIRTVALRSAPWQGCVLTAADARLADRPD